MSGDLRDLTGSEAGSDLEGPFPNHEQRPAVTDWPLVRRRLIARTLDAVIVAPALAASTFFVVAQIAHVDDPVPGTGDGTPYIGQALLLALTLQLVYGVYQLAGECVFGGTLPKWALGLRIVTRNGRKAGFRLFLGRWAFYWILLPLVSLFVTARPILMALDQLQSIPDDALYYLGLVLGPLVYVLVVDPLVIVKRKDHLSLVDVATGTRVILSREAAHARKPVSPDESDTGVHRR